MLRIDTLANHPEAISTLASWSHNQWGYLYPERTLEDVEKAVAQRTNTDHIPLALVAHDGDELVGTVCLKEHDMDNRQELTPWLAGLYVKASRRGEGFGRQLVAAIEKKARELGVETLYLYTPESEGFYRQLGWSAVEHVEYHGHPATIMSKQI
jgi:predicted N-acetyltransferase YhbS